MGIKISAGQAGLTTMAMRCSLQGLEDAAICFEQGRNSAKHSRACRLPVWLIASPCEEVTAGSHFSSSGLVTLRLPTKHMSAPSDSLLPRSVARTLPTKHNRNNSLMPLFLWAASWAHKKPMYPHNSCRIHCPGRNLALHVQDATREMLGGTAA